MSEPYAVSVSYEMSDGDVIKIPLGSSDTPPPVTGLSPSVPSDVASQLEATPVFNDLFTEVAWGEAWSPTWFTGQNFNGMQLDPRNIVFLPGGGVELRVSNGGRTGCFMVTNPNNGDCGGFEFRYGYDEIEAVIEAGAAWPSAWNNGQTWPYDGEDDVVELIQSANQWSANYHDSDGHGGDRAQNSGPIAGNWAGQRVIYGGVRLPNGIVKHFWNGQQVGKTLTVNDQGAPHYLIQSAGDSSRGGSSGITVYRRTVWLVKGAATLMEAAPEKIPEDALLANPSRHV